MKQKIILSRLLDKYENSKHLLEPGTSKRRVMLRIDKKELPEYNYEDASTRDEFNHAAKELEHSGLISTEWFPGRPVLSAVILNLAHVMQCYSRIGRVHPKDLAAAFVQMVSSRLEMVTTEWIRAWQEDVCAAASETYDVPAFCKKDLAVLLDLLQAFAVFDALGGTPISMRAFSSKCYHDTKIFEREIRDMFLRIARKYHTGLAEACEQTEMGVRDQLAYLGIYARPELYELSGDCEIHTMAGTVHMGAAIPYGLGVPSTSVASICSFDLSRIREITLIENKTNYDEYLLSELHPGELAVYHGGFLSPQKQKFFAKLAEAALPQTVIRFWADIDLGGFRMFAHLQNIFPTLLPMRMTGEDVMRHRGEGLPRTKEYLEKLSAAQEEFPLFQDTIERILEYGVTIEQETFLSK